jgi:hypothetical protein
MLFDRTGRLITFSALLAIIIGNCGCSVDDAALNSPAVKSGSANFTTVVSLGNSLTAGFADGALGEAGQKFSYPSPIAKQMGATFNQPLIKEPGVGLDLQGNPAGRMQLISLSPPVVSSIPLNGPPQVISLPPYNNFAVPGAKIVVANIPDVTLIPFVTTLEPYVVDLQTLEPIKDSQGRNIPLLGTFSDGLTGPLSDDPSTDNFTYVTLVGASFIAQGMGIPQGIGNGTGQPLPTFGVLDKAEVAQIKTRIGELNSIIAAAAARGIPAVDINNLLKQIHANGISIGGIDLTTEYITGGIFSLDAVHPTPVGYGIVANAFINRINEHYGSNIQEMNLAELLEQGSLVKSLVKSNKANPFIIRSDLFAGMIRTITGREIF